MVKEKEEGDWREEDGNNKVSMGPLASPRIGSRDHSFLLNFITPLSLSIYLSSAWLEMIAISVLFIYFIIIIAKLFPIQPWSIKWKFQIII